MLVDGLGPLGHGTYFENDELQFGDVVGMDPVLGCLADEVLLAATCSTISRNRVSSSTDQVV